MNTKETLIVINAITRWGLSSLSKAINHTETCQVFPSKDEMHIEKIIDRLDSSKPIIKEKLLSFHKHFNLEKEIITTEQQGIRIICFYDKEYPESLLHIPNPPLLLYVKGDIDFNAGIGIAVVGSRKSSCKGKSLAFKISSELAYQGITIISGLAFGIDAEAHRGAIKVNGKTIAVLGNGLSFIYPKEHNELSKSVVEHGALVSEFPMEQAPFPSHFPRRNRLISGMSKGVLVVEAAKKSGSLITARYACEQGKDVFSVPGSPCDKNSEGTNALIKDGAKLTTSADDIMEELSFLNLALTRTQVTLSQDLTKSSHLTSDEKNILSILGLDPLSMEEISIRSQLNVKKVSHILLTMELKKYIKVYPGNRYGLNYRRTKHEGKTHEKKSCYR